MLGTLFNRRALFFEPGTPWTLCIVDCGLVGLATIFPFIMGGRLALGHLLLIIAAALLCIAWVAYQSRLESPVWRWSGAEPWLVLGALWLCMQMVSLPPQLLNKLSPEISRILPLWTDHEPAASSTDQDANSAASPDELIVEEATANIANTNLRLGTWTKISLAPYETRSNFSIVLACMLIFWVALQRIRSVNEVTQFLRWMGLAGAAMATFGIIQFVTSNGRFFWFFEHPHTSTMTQAKGAFTNANHFASLLAMSLPLLAASYLVAGKGQGRSEGGESFATTSSSRRSGSRSRTRQSDKSSNWAGPLLLSAMTVVVLGVLLAQSRGGLLVMLLGVVASMCLLWRQGLLSTRIAGGVLAAGVASLMGLALFGDQIERAFVQQVESITSNDLDQIDSGAARRWIWATNWEGIQRFPLTGTGLGTHREVYPTWFDHPNEVEYSHAENGYLQITLETGWPGLALAASFALTVLWACWRTMRAAQGRVAGGLAAAIAAALFVNLVHSLSDFVWYVPGIMVWVMLLSACAFALLRESQRATLETSANQNSNIIDYSSDAAVTTWPVRLGSLFVAMLGIAGLVWTLPLKLHELAAEPTYFARERLVISSTLATREQLDFKKRDFALRIAIARANPYSHRANYWAATSYTNMLKLALDNRENGMSLNDIREAGQASEFPTADDLHLWLQKPGVLGKRFKYIEAADQLLDRSLALCPLQSSCYLERAELAWFQNLPVEDDQAIIDQAHTVRPFDSRVQFKLGDLARYSEGLEAALPHWIAAFQNDRIYRRVMITELADDYPPSFFLENFPMDTVVLEQLFSAYRTGADRNGFRRVVLALSAEYTKAAVSTKGDEACRKYLKIFGLMREIKDNPAARQALQSAVKSNPHSVPARRILGEWAFEQHDYALAARELSWCVRRVPQDKALRELAADASKKQAQVAVQTNLEHR